MSNQDYGEYWITVLGQTSPTQIAQECDLFGTTRDEIDEWLNQAEVEALREGNVDRDEWDDILEGWATFHRDALEALVEAADEGASVSIPTRVLKAIEALDFGEVEDYYHDEREIRAKREAWNDSKEEWKDAREALLDATKRAEVEEALVRMSDAEAEWGDDPTTTDARRILTRAGII